MNKVCVLLRADTFIASEKANVRTGAERWPPFPADSVVVIYLPAAEISGTLESVMPIIVRPKAGPQTAFRG